MNKPRKITPLSKQTPQRSIQLSSLQKFLLLLLLIVASLTTLPVLVVLLVGLLPTFTLLIIDGKNLNKLIVVGCFNLAGVFTYMFNMISNFSMDNAMFIFSDIFNMILMLGSAGIGLIVYYEVPQLFIYLARTSNQKQIANIDAKVAKMQEVWGKDITG